MPVEFFNAADGARLAYRDEGAGLPVLCLAGLTRSMDDFDYLAPSLADCRMIRMDYRGRGQSDWTGADSSDPSASPSFMSTIRPRGESISSPQSE